MHNTIQIEPNKAKLPGNFMWVVWHLQNAAKKNRKYEEIKTSDYVRVNKQKQNQLRITKGQHPTYSSTKHKVISIHINIT